MSARSVRKMTFGQLQAQLGHMSPEQLARPVIWWGDEIGGYVSELLALAEDHIVHEDGCEPRSVYADQEMPEVLETLPSGTLVFLVDEELSSDVFAEPAAGDGVAGDT